MKALKPSMREKKRYLFIKGKNLKECVEKAVLEFVGVRGLAKAGLNWIKSEKENAIISINREAVNDIRASLCIWPEKITVERISGTLKGLREKIQ